MKVVNILKDGTIVDDMSKVVVPKEVVNTVADIAKNNVNESKKK